MLITTRNATIQDIPVLVEMMKEFYAESDYPLDQQWAAKSFATLLSNEFYGTALIASCDDEAAGYVVLTVKFSMEYGGLEACIDDLFVRPSHRRKGVGRAALEALWAECKRREALAIQVEVAPDNAAAKVLYQAFGLGLRDDERHVLTARLNN